MRWDCDGCAATATIDSGQPDPTDTAVEFETCESAPVATAALVDEVERSGGQWLVCGEKTDGQECKPLEEVAPTVFISSAIGTPSDPDFCSWDGVGVLDPKLGGDRCVLLRFDIGLICEGRPVRVEGDVAVAPLTPGTDWSDDISLKTVH